jgi:hypothetical protein
MHSLGYPRSRKNGGHSEAGAQPCRFIARRATNGAPPSEATQPKRESAGYLTMLRFGLISSRNSIRVDSRVRNTPSIAEVTAFAFCFSTPRIIMHR